ncbi:hypothetical protein HK405_014926 [Cladochytrium tenue]|nr:hypothetical protein HK405_014926 [Cladochytrium tenue]
MIGAEVDDEAVSELIDVFTAGFSSAMRVTIIFSALMFVAVLFVKEYRHSGRAKKVADSPVAVATPGDLEAEAVQEEEIVVSPKANNEALSASTFRPTANMVFRSSCKLDGCMLIMLDRASPRIRHAALSCVEGPNTSRLALNDLNLEHNYALAAPRMPFCSVAASEHPWCRAPRPPSSRCHWTT